PLLYLWGKRPAHLQDIRRGTHHPPGHRRRGAFPHSRNWNGEETLTFQYSCGAVLSVIYQGEEYWYIKNAQGDVTGLMDKNGQMVVTYTYDSWGVPVSREGSMKDTLGLLNPFRYREYIYDDESGLYYLQTRYYDPRVGRFLNADIMMASNGDFPSC